ncbi:hypothetical protein GCM10010329_82660 [Streptomyces spiroverticillatus]|uniref:Uncharacterized protein n=1 Tax=Streptomyces finlayi TaxID=67296 RepID=A0A918X8U7_9ACTN|nr:hypothetical protein [Streptomyces finlayi]GHA47723.1 hypothetical protein GCM10010329_82660 [Streptomyces spiroverticillatus]GHD18688.1 hypothetical protein GCM10010334_81730 [Streptomyces finlayi]
MAHHRTRPSRHGILTPRSYLPGGYAPAAFKEIILSDGVHSGYLTGWEADGLIQQTADHSRRTVEALVRGELRIRDRRIRHREVRLTPVVHPKKLTARQYADLELINHAGRGTQLRYDPDGTPCAIEAGFWRIPYTQTSILLGRGWLSQWPHTDEVYVSAAGCMAMALWWHAQQGLPARVLKGLYLDAVLTAADAHRVLLARHVGQA